MNRPVAAAERVAAKAGTIVVTGVAHAGQLGVALARDFARHGNRVAIIARADADAAARASELHADGFDVHPFACDLSDPAATVAVAAAVCQLGPVAALINAAGGFGFSGPVADADPAVAAKQFTINAITAYNATRAFLPALRATRGAVVFFASAAALPGARVRNVSGYAMAKSAVLTLMRAVAQEEHANGVRANAIAPGAIRTNANLSSMPADTRYVEPESVSAVVRFLCSTEAADVNGQVLELAP